MNEGLEGRLLNFKFDSALQYLEGESEEVIELVNLLAKLFGNVGSILGDFALIIENALGNIGVNYNEDEV